MTANATSASLLPLIFSRGVYPMISIGILTFSFRRIKASKKARAEKSAAIEIETEKESILGNLEHILTSIQKDRIEKETSQPVAETLEGTIAREINLREVISRAFRTKIQRFHQSYTNLIWPHVLCRNGRKITISGFIMFSIGVATIMVFPETYENLFLEAIFLGIVFIAAGYSLIWKTGRKLVTWLSLPSLIGIIMSLGSIIIFIHLSTLTSIEEEIQNIALAYIIGIFFLVVDILIGKRYKHLAANE